MRALDPQDLERVQELREVSGRLDGLDPQAEELQELQRQEAMRALTGQRAEELGKVGEAMDGLDPQAEELQELQRQEAMRALTGQRAEELRGIEGEVDLGRTRLRRSWIG